MLWEHIYLNDLIVDRDANLCCQAVVTDRCDEYTSARFLLYLYSQVVKWCVKFNLPQHTLLQSVKAAYNIIPLSYQHDKQNPSWA